MQFIFSFYGGKLSIVNSKTHVANRHSVQIIDSEFSKIYGKTIEVNSYHNYGIDQSCLPLELAPTALFDRYVEAFKAKNQLFHGIMWHPERENVFSISDIEFFKKILKNEV